MWRLALIFVRERPPSGKTGVLSWWAARIKHKSAAALAGSVDGVAPSSRHSAGVVSEGFLDQLAIGCIKAAPGDVTEIKSLLEGEHE